MKRRAFIATAALGAASARSLLAASTPQAGAVRAVGKLVDDCTLAGERRRDGAFPAHPNGLRLSRDRFLLIYATRGWRGVDEDRSIVYQVRAGAFDGPVLKEGLLARAIDDWDPLGDGRKCFKSHGHPCGFGVPKGALIRGRPAPQANLFVLKWYNYARLFSAPGELGRPLADDSSRLSAATLRIQWMHVRLNATDDDLEIVEPISTLRAPGHAPGDRAGEHLNQGFSQAQPFNPDATEWVDMISAPWPDRDPPAGAGPVAAKYRYIPARHRYEWVQAGPRFFPQGLDASEGGLVRLSDGWAICARPHKDANLPLLWARLDDPFARPARRVLAQPRAGQPIVRGPTTAYRCADGRIRVFGGDREGSPYDNRRHPLYAWEADPGKDFALTRRQVVFDILAADVGVRAQAEPIADMCKLLPHAGGSTQWIVHRFRTESINFRRDRPASTNPEPQFRISPAVTETERALHGIYLARLDYGTGFPDEWTFAAAR